MLKNYLLIFARKINRNLLVQIANILGMSIGLAISFLILLYLINETGFDKQHKKGNRIYRLICNFHPEGSESNYTISNIEDKLIQTLRNEFPEIERTSSIYRFSSINQLRSNGLLSIEKNICFAESEILDIFTLELLKGDIKNPLPNDFDILVTESKAKSYFKNENPIGKVVTLETNNDTILLTVKGVIKDFPLNSTLRFDFIGKISNRVKHNENIYSEETYLLLNQKANYKELEKKFPVNKYIDGAVMVSSYALQPFHDIYFNSDYINSYFKRTGNKTNVCVLCIIAFVMLVVSINNYILFSTFDSKSILKDITIRKAAGATIRNLQVQQFSSSLLFSITSFVVAFLITYFLIPLWNNYFEVDLYSILYYNFLSIAGIITITLITIIFSGLYVSIYIGRLNPLQLFNSSFIKVKRSNVSQKFIIGLQVLLFVSLTSFLVFVNNQIKFAITKETGYNKENVLVIDFTNKELKNKYHEFKSELNKLPFVLEVSAMNIVIPNSNFMKIHFPRYKDPSKNVVSNLIVVDKNFFNTLSIPIGNENSERKPVTIDNSYIINKVAAKELGIPNESVFPINLPSSDGYTMIIARICGDFDIQSVNHQLTPLAIYIKESYLGYILVKLSSSKPDDAEKQVEALYTKIVSKDYPINTKYMTDYIEEAYKKDKLFLNAISLGAIVIAIITALGLFNISLLNFKSRTKEILLRKVVGAKELSILTSLAIEEIIIVICANALAIPLIIISLDQWLNNYVQHISITSNIFILTFVLSMLLMLIVSVISLKIVLSKNVITELNKT